MKIDSYSFGKIIIDGETYTKDLIIFPDKIKTNWWRKKGHFLQLEDLEEVIAFDPQNLIIGTGAYGLMRIDKQVEAKLEELNIELIAEKSSKAVEIYNGFEDKSRVAAGFHLTC